MNDSLTERQWARIRQVLEENPELTWPKDGSKLVEQIHRKYDYPQSVWVEAIRLWGSESQRAAIQKFLEKTRGQA